MELKKIEDCVRSEGHLLYYDMCLMTLYSCTVVSYLSPSRIMTSSNPVYGILRDIVSQNTVNIECVCEQARERRRRDIFVLCGHFSKKGQYYTETKTNLVQN